MQPPYDNDATPSYNDPIPSVPSGAGTPPTPQFSSAPSGRPPTVRFEAIGEAWTLFQQQMGTWVTASLIYFLIVGTPTLLALGPVYYRIFTTDEATLNADPTLILLPMAAAYAVIFLFVVPVSMILLGGLYRMALQQMRGAAIGAGDLFNITDVLGSLIGAMFLITLSVVAGAIIGCILCGLPSIVVAALLMLTLPLIVDRRIGSVEAMKLSWNALKPHWLMATLFYLVISMIGQIGTVACYVGIIFTFPILIIANAILYRDFFDRADSTISRLETPAPPTGFGYTPQ